MNVIIAAGSSGGHLFPGLSLANYLQQENVAESIVLLVTEQSKHCLVSERNDAIEYVYLPTIRRQKNMFRFIRALVRSMIRSFLIIRKRRPHLVIGFGSYISFAAVVSAWLQGIPTVIHEQNVRFGLTNRVLQCIARRIAISFPKEYYSSGLHPKMVYTGNLLRPNILAALSNSGVKRIHDTKWTVIVIGGSQGARSVNEAVVSMFESMDKSVQKKIRVYHLAGEQDCQVVQERYKKLMVEHYVFSFYNDVEAVYKNADIAITRAGAGTLFELMAFGIPSVLIPYPYAGAHQMENAKYFAERGAAVIEEETHLTPESLCSRVIRLLESDKERRCMTRSCYMLAKIDGLEIMKELLVAVAQARR